jgi:hypothetical protein
MVVKALRKEYIHTFPAAHSDDSNSGTNLNESLLSEITVHLLCLKEELSRYFLAISNKFIPLVICPFKFDSDKVPEIAQEHITMTNDRGIESEFSSFLETKF